jgi:hypothetical protein
MVARAAAGCTQEQAEVGRRPERSGTGRSRGSQSGSKSIALAAPYRADLAREVFGLDGWHWFPPPEGLGPDGEGEHHALVRLGRLEQKRRDGGLDPDERED